MKKLILLFAILTSTVGLYAQSDKEKAMEHFLIAKEAYKKDYYDKESWAEGMVKTENELNKSLELDQSIPEVFYFRALLFTTADQPNEAIEFCTYAIQLDSSNAEYFLRRGVIHSKQEKYTHALFDLNMALEIDPENANAYYNLGMIYYYTDQNEGACEKFKKALELGQNDAQQGIESTCGG